MEDGQRLYFYAKKGKDAASVVDCANLWKYHMMYMENEYYDEFRESYLAIKDYVDLAVIDKGEGKEQIGRLRIISPFTRLFDFSLYTSDIIGSTIDDVRKYVSEHTESLIPLALIEYTKKNNVNKNISKERIVKCYQTFISNYLFVKNGGTLTEQNNSSNNDDAC